MRRHLRIGSSELSWLGHLFWMPPQGGVHWEEAPRKDQETLESPRLSAGLGAPWTPPGRAGGGAWGEEGLGVSA